MSDELVDRWAPRLRSGRLGQESKVADLVTEDETLSRAFEERLGDSSALAFRVAYSVLRHRQDAEDVAQEAFVRAHKSFRQLRDREAFRAWLVRMTWRLALDKRRGDQRRTSRELSVLRPPAPPTTEDALIAEQRSARLWQAIDALPGKFRMVVVLTSIEEQRVEDVAVLLKIPAGTVKSRLFEARKRLQELLR